MNFSKITKLWYILLFVPLVFMTSCSDDDEAVIAPISSFQFEIDANDFFLVNFSNFSQNSTAYAWDFGDNVGSSTDESPSYTYSASGTYTVTLIASDAAGASSESTKDIIITDPDEALTLLAGSVSKTWKLLRDGAALGIGPSFDEFYLWWNLTNDGSRNCLFDDEFIFTRDGGFEHNDGGTFFGEGAVYTTGSDQEGLFERCFDATNANLTIDGVDKSAWLSSSSHSYTYDVSTSNITLTGLGAWIGLVKFGTDGDVTEPQATTSFGITITDGGASGVDTLDVLFDHNPNFWKARYVSYSNPADEPALTTAAPKPDFTYVVNGLDVTFTNTSKDSESYSWDFGDGASSSEESPVHTYAGAGCYDVVLTANGQGLTETKEYQVLVTAAATFAASDLSSASGKVWKLAGEGSYKVGPAPGAGDWWGGIDATGVTERACQMDDEFIFTDGGVFEYADQGEVWAEGYMGGSVACIDPADLAAPFNGFSSATHAFTADATTITVNGSGAFIGWSLAYNGGEVTSSDSALPTSITYTVHEYIASPCKEVLVLYVETAAGTFWTISLESTN